MYASDYDSDSVASENQPLIYNFYEIFYLLCWAYVLMAERFGEWIIFFCIDIQTVNILYCYEQSNMYILFSERKHEAMLSALRL